MSSVIPVPADLRARYSRTAEGLAWLAALPGNLAAGLERWRLTVDLPAGAEPWNGHGGIVVPVLRDGQAAVLKVAFPHPEALPECHALTLWDGRGAVRLLEADQDTCSMLLERLDADSWLQDAALDHARDAWGMVVRQLSIDAGDGPGWDEFEHAAAKAERWSDELPADWEQLGRPFPRWLLEAALEVCQTRGAVGRRTGKDVLVHADLHFMNIIPLPGSSDLPDVGSYRAIDPQPVIGEAEFGVAPVLWNRIAELPQSSPELALLERCNDFSNAAGLDPEIARQWSLTREVENALWYAAKPGHDGDLARSLWVASTLAGRTLDGLPAAHELPAPGGAALG